MNQEMQICLLDAISSCCCDPESSFGLLSHILCNDRKLCESAFEVLDSIQYITKYSSKSFGRTIWIVPGSRGIDYICLQRYCSCRRFLELSKLSIHNDQSVLCKHLVAIKLANTFGKEKQIVSLREMFKLDSQF